ncbi:MAG: TraB/GumN family protein, partial [Dehalococcoidales bacterium]
ENGMYATGDGFKNNTPAGLYNQLLTKFQKFGSDLTQYNDYKPWVIYNIMSQFILNSLGYTTDLSMDDYFLGKAAKTHKNIFELETIKYQLDLLSSIPDTAIFAAMQYDVDNPETAQDLKDIFDAWQKGSFTKMNDIVFKAKKEQPDMASYYDIMYDQRNANILQKIEALLVGNQTCFVVVSAGLLVDDNGLIHTLLTKGYHVEQLSVN